MSINIYSSKVCVSSKTTLRLRTTNCGPQTPTAPITNTKATDAVVEYIKLRLLVIIILFPIELCLLWIISYLCKR